MYITACLTRRDDISSPASGATTLWVGLFLESDVVVVLVIIDVAELGIDVVEAQLPTIQKHA